MNGKYFGVYDLRNNEQCVGVFESIEEICDFFGGFSKDRIHHNISRKQTVTIKKERYEIVSFAEPTVREARLKLRARFGKGHFEIRENGEIYIRQENEKGWKYYADSFVSAIEAIGQ